MHAMMLGILAVLLLSPHASFAQGAEDAEWCLTRATKRIHKQSMRNNYCLGYVAGWGQHHQNNLARDAIQAIVCEGNVSRAIDYLKVCQCHNKGSHDSLSQYESQIRDWAIARAPQIGMICPSRPQPQPVAQPTGPINANCICQYSNGQVGAWFRYRPHNYGTMGVVEVSAARCEDLAVCERFPQAGGYSYKFYTGRISMRVNNWTHQQNYVNGFEVFSLWGTAE